MSKTSPIDRQPFRSKAEQERQQTLENRYGSVAIPELVAILKQMKQKRADKAA